MSAITLFVPETVPATPLRRIRGLVIAGLAIIAVFVLGLASSYLGVFICFNHWGT